MSIRYTAEQLQRKFAGPAGAPGYARVADALRAEGRLEEAIGLCREGLRSRPLVAGFVVLGKTLVDAGNLDEAREQFEAALRLDPRCLSAMHALASIMGKLQWADAAAGYYRSILELEPWDAEIRSLLEGVAHNTGAMPASAPAGAPSPAESGLPRHEEETFTKPDGLQGDVLEVNLNDLADEFLPSGGEESDVSLEDALEGAGAAQASEGDFSPAPDSAYDRNAMEAHPAPSGPETLGENAPAPISGSDVEERLDSLFGNEDGGTPSATATWTAAPALADGFSEASATATGELRIPEAGPDAGFPDVSSHFELAEPPDMGSAAPEPPESGAGPMDETSRVQGEDIEQRLDELFNLSDEDDRPKPAPLPASELSASELPVAPGPKMGETVILGEAVPFGDRDDGLSGAEDDPAILAEETDAAFAEPAAPAEEAATLPAENEWVTGQDVADKLDTLFGTDPKQSAFPAAAPFFAEKAPPEPGPGEALLSTESMLPSAWAGDAPQVTGDDVEAQLDKLFNLEPTAPAPAADAAVPETAAFADAPETVPAAPRAEPTAAPQRNLDETVTFERPSERPGEGEKGRLKESVADWLARQEDGPSAGDTLILPNEGIFNDAGPETAPEEKAGEDLFGALAPEEIPGLSETASIEMVDGGDVAQRLDKLFSDAPGGMAGEVPLFEPEVPPLPEIAEPEFETEPEPAMTLEMPIPELDETGTMVGGSGPAPISPAENGVEDVNRLSAATPASGAGPDAAGKAAPELAPMLDEEDGYPDEEEMPVQAAAANVATVTLAEIYFQQGLKEQALQIYRQLLEREPENESVRKRITEIEASKPDTDRGPDSDPRRPRPGLKVPKRKK